MHQLQCPFCHLWYPAHPSRYKVAHTLLLVLIITSSVVQPDDSYEPTAMFPSGTPVVTTTPTSNFLGAPSLLKVMAPPPFISNLPFPSPPPPPPHVLLQISVRPLGVNLAAGQTTTLYCEATLPAKLTWLFRFNSLLPGNLEVVTDGPTKSSLTIHNMTEGNSGIYACSSAAEGGDPVYEFATVTFLGKLW